MPTTPAGSNVVGGSGQAPRLRRQQLLLVAAALCVGFALMLAHAFTKAPHVDEGDLGSAAVSILEQGRMAFPHSYYYLPSFRNDYLLPPLYFYTLAGWFKVAGQSLESYRAFHVAWWILLTLSWVSIVRSAARTSVAIVIAAVLLAINYDTINLGVSRYDITTAALNAAAVAAYLAWRRDHFTRAVCASNAFLALAAITHPHALFGLVTCLLVAMSTGDWRRVRARDVVAAFAPYVLAFGAWAFLIDGRWELFLDQMLYGARSKRGLTGNPFATIAADLQFRWWELFAGWRSGVPTVMRAKTGFLVVWLLAIGAALLPGHRDESSRIRRALALSTMAIVVILAFIDTLHLQIYVLNVVPPAVASLALVLAELHETRRSFRPLVVAAVVSMALFAVAAISFRVRKAELQSSYAPVAALVSDSLRAGEVAIVPSELAYRLGFDVDFRNDPDLTSVGAGPFPRIIVLAEEQGALQLPEMVPCAADTPAFADSATYTDLTPPPSRAHYRVFIRPRIPAHTDTGRVVRRRCGGR